jgi:hypothetical protein
VNLGFAATFSCADNITIGNRVLMAHFASIYDNNNHPIDPDARSKNMPKKDKTLLFADRNMAKVQWYVKREVNTASCGAENALRSPRKAAPD